MIGRLWGRRFLQKMMSLRAPNFAAVYLLINHKDTRGMKTNQRTDERPKRTSEMPPSDPNKRLEGLLNRQYPMSQDEPSQQTLNQAYLDRMDQLIKEYENEL